MPKIFQVADPSQMPVSVELEPAHNVLNSMALLNEVQRRPALDAWVVQTAAALTPEQRHRNQLIFDHLLDALLPDHDWPDFPAYLDDLAAQEPARLRERVQLPDTPGDDPLWAEAQALLYDPPALRDLIIGHLRAIWEGGLADEWKRALLPLQKTVATIKHRAKSEMAAIADNLRMFVAGDALYEPGVQQIICAPSPHVGRYVTRVRQGSTLRLFFHGPSSYAVVMRISPVGRAELLTRLSGLADETRLRILELFAEQNELSAQEIMARLDLSQSSVSRHLKQLAPYVVERRGEGASKFYGLSPAQLSLTFQALRQILEGDTAEIEEQPPALADYPRDLRRFLDAQGRATAWPTKRRDQLLLLEYMAAQFEPGRDYTEKQVNAMLIAHMHPTFDDYAILRRELYNYGYLDRERDGSRYWRAERPVASADAG